MDLRGAKAVPDLEIIELGLIFKYENIVLSSSLRFPSISILFIVLDRPNLTKLSRNTIIKRYLCILFVINLKPYNKYH